MSPQPSLFFVVGGPNGTGKSTFSSAYRAAGFKVLDPDQLAREQHLTDAEAWTVSRDVAEGCLESGKSIVVESTLAGGDLSRPSTYIRMMESARERGFRVLLTFICVQGPDLLIARIHGRVQAGLHRIDEEIVRERYAKTLKRLPSAIAAADTAHVVDNTGSDYKTVLRIEDKTLAYLAPQRPEWAETALSTEIPTLIATDRARVLAKLGTTHAVVDAEGITTGPIVALGGTHVAVDVGPHVALAAGVNVHGLSVGESISFRADEYGFALDQEPSVDAFSWALF